MKLSTPLAVIKSPLQISYDDSLLFVGSCFANNIGRKMSALKFDALVNPFGTLYNPSSIYRALRHSIANSKLQSEDLILRDGIHVHYDFHSDLSDCVQQSIPEIEFREELAIISERKNN